MSEAMVADFTMRANALSYEETFSVISILLERLKNSVPQRSEKIRPAFLDEILSIAEANPEIHKSEGDWTRDELYRY